MNTKCNRCRGQGVLARDGHATKTGKPYDVCCPNCNGRGILVNQ